MVEEAQCCGKIVDFSQKEAQPFPVTTSSFSQVSTGNHKSLHAWILAVGCMEVDLGKYKVPYNHHTAPNSAKWHFVKNLSK